MKHPFLVLIYYLSLVIPNKTPHLVFTILQNTLVCFFQTPFEELNPETLSNQVMKYAKTVMQLEKGLPPNSVVPILKDKVEGMRHKVLDQQQLSLYPRFRKDLCLLGGNSSKSGPISVENVKCVVVSCQPPPQALRFSQGRGERETSDW